MASPNRSPTAVKPLSKFPAFRGLFGSSRATPTQRRSLLRLIATAAERRLDLPALVQAWARDERGAQSLRLERLANTLGEGVPLADAVERVNGLLNDEEVLSVRCGAQSGSLAATLRRRLDDAWEPDEGARRNIHRVANYLAFFLVLFTPVAPFMQLKILPEFEKIFQEFDLDPGEAMEIARIVSNIAFGAWLFVALLAAFAVWSRYFRWPADVLRRAIVPRLLAPVRQRRVGAVLRRLGESAAAGRPLAGTVSTLARYHYDPAVRHQLLVARNELALGTEPWPALRGAGLVTPQEATALAAGDVAGTGGWTLETLGEARRRQADGRLQTTMAILAPLVIFAAGFFVLTQALGVLTPLVRLVEALA